MSLNNCSAIENGENEKIQENCGSRNTRSESYYISVLGNWENTATVQS